VEDEEAVRSTVRRILVRSGYTVHEAGSGREALERWRGRTHEFDLLLTDLVMPEGISGTELAEQLWIHRPDLKVIFMSGYSASVAGKEADFLQPKKSRFLQKPCPPREILDTIRECLDQRNEEELLKA
jgi:DNA-binding NtrC family response regulator